MTLGILLALSPFPGTGNASGNTPYKLARSCSMETQLRPSPSVFRDVRFNRVSRTEGDATVLPLAPPQRNDADQEAMPFERWCFGGEKSNQKPTFEYFLSEHGGKKSTNRPSSLPTGVTDLFSATGSCFLAFLPVTVAISMTSDLVLQHLQLDSDFML